MKPSNQNINMMRKPKRCLKNRYSMVKWLVAKGHTVFIVSWRNPSAEDRSMVDLLAWNADTTRMPYKMHSEYLEKLFLNNDFAAGRFTLEGEHVVAENIHIPAFVVSTETDHVAPWQSVYKTHLMISSDMMFVLARGAKYVCLSKINR